MVHANEHEYEMGFGRHRLTKILLPPKKVRVGPIFGSLSQLASLVHSPLLLDRNIVGSVKVEILRSLAGQLITVAAMAYGRNSEGVKALALSGFIVGGDESKLFQSNLRMPAYWQGNLLRLQPWRPQLPPFLSGFD
ncbi:hypothetical protein Tco_0340927 [Tanacetum coccineum]